ncbi:hypothetical protein [Marisediminicola antarctica]|uniref:hypothetical protein n=1 Tax=Marisediminicola antarctica TaxID=674079 RepID=UPI00137A26FA|nr:hypothetical protein [Marisediminicola antarctica]
MSVSDHPLIPDTETRLSVLLNRIHVLGKVEGVTVVAERVDLTGERVWLHARAVPNSSTEQLTTEFWSAGQRWRHVQQTQGWEAAGEPPRGPGEMMTRIEVTLTKNSPGVNFDRQLSVGGSGTEWSIEWSWPRPNGGSVTFIGTSPEAGDTELIVEMPSPK